MFKKNLKWTRNWGINGSLQKQTSVSEENSKVSDSYMKKSLSKQSLIRRGLEEFRIKTAAMNLTKFTNLSKNFPLLNI